MNRIWIVLEVIIIFVVITLFSSGSCDPARDQTPYSITNKSQADIVFAHYYVENTLNIKDYLLRSLQEDIEIFTTTGPYYEVLKPDETFTVQSLYSREDYLEETTRALFFIWILETDNLTKLNSLSPITLDDIDFYFLGYAKQLENMNWEIVYDGTRKE